MGLFFVLLCFDLCSCLSVKTSITRQRTKGKAQSTKHKVPDPILLASGSYLLSTDCPLCHNAFEVNWASLTKPRQPHKILRKSSCSRLDVYFDYRFGEPNKSSENGGC